MSTLTASHARTCSNAIPMTDPTPSPPSDIQTTAPDFPSPVRFDETGPKRLSDPDSAPHKILDTPGNRLSRSTSHAVFPKPNNFSRKVRLSTNPSSEEMSVNSTSERNEIPRSSRGGHPGRKVEFFSPATFQQVLSDPTTNHQLLLFARSRLCGEDVEFLGRVRVPQAKPYTSPL